MCLITYDKKAETADKPIPCYKVVWKTQRGFSSEYQDFRYDIGAEYSMEHGAYFPWSNHAYPAQLLIQCGFHSYVKLKDASDSCWEYQGTSRINMDDFYGQVILRCEIPKGARYWTGNINLFGPGYKEYCSDHIRVTGWKFRGEKRWRTKTKSKNG